MIYKYLVPYNFPRGRQWRGSNSRYPHGVLCRYREFIRWRSPRNHGKSTDVIYSNTTWKFATDLLDQAIKIGGINGQ